jgi:hypothetical protein
LGDPCDAVAFGEAVDSVAFGEAVDSVAFGEDGDSVGWVFPASAMVRVTSGTLQKGVLQTMKCPRVSQTGHTVEQSGSHKEDGKDGAPNNAGTMVVLLTGQSGTIPRGNG